MYSNFRKINYYAISPPANQLDDKHHAHKTPPQTKFFYCFICPSEYTTSNRYYGPGNPYKRQIWFISLYLMMQSDYCDFLNSLLGIINCILCEFELLLYLANVVSVEQNIQFYRPSFCMSIACGVKCTALMASNEIRCFYWCFCSIAVNSRSRCLPSNIQYLSYCISAWNNVSNPSMNLSFANSITWKLHRNRTLWKTTHFQGDLFFLFAKWRDCSYTATITQFTILSLLRFWCYLWINVINWLFVRQSPSIDAMNTETTKNASIKIPLKSWKM